MSEVKNFTPMDLALLRRVAAKGLNLNIAETIGNPNPLETALLGAVGIKGRGRPTYILRTGKADFAVQMRVEETHVRLTLLAPAPVEEGRFHPWLALLDNVVWQSGRRGAQVVTAEVPVETPAFELFRRGGFTVYSRERVYCRLASGECPNFQDQRLEVRPIVEQDDSRLNTLYTSTVPQMVQQVVPLPKHGWHGLALLLNGRLLGALEICSGKNSLLIQPVLHPELYDLIPVIFGRALEFLPKQTIYVRLRAHQEWLRNALEMDLGFIEHGRYALMARHTVVQKPAVVFSPRAVLENIALTPSIEVALEISAREKKHNGIPDYRRY